MGLYHCPGPEEGGLKQETLFLLIEVIRNVLELDSVSSEERINNQGTFFHIYKLHNLKIKNFGQIYEALSNMEENVWLSAGIHIHQ